MLFLLPPSFLWDVTPADKLVAISIYDQSLITPQMDDSDDQPTLYLIDRNEESAHKVAGSGVVPAFSPDGSVLSYIAATGEAADVPVIYRYDVENHESRLLDGTIGALTLFWIDNETLGFTLESGDDTYKLMQVSLTTGKITPLLPDT